MEIFVLVPLILLVTFVMGFLFKRIGMPAVVGQILAGILLGIPFLRAVLFDSESALVIVDFLAYLGIIFLLFLAGLEIDIEKIRETSRESLLISLSSALVPFALGFTFMMLVFPSYGWLAALVFGGAMMVTSEATKVKVLMDLNSLNTHLGAIMLAAGALDDIFEVLFLALVAVIGRGGGLIELAAIPVEIVIFVVVAFAFFKGASKIFRYLDRKGGNQTEIFSLVVIFIMVLAALSEGLGIGYLIGAIAGGFILQIAMKNIHERHRKDMIKVTELIALGFIVPFFFANVGINFEFDTLFSSIGLLVATVVIAFSGKIVGCIVIKPFSRLTLKQLYYTGWAMNSRGAAELVIALAAKQLGLIPLEVFSALVAMSLITTLTFPPVLARGIHRNPGLMNVVASEAVET
ncbi:cation:proton antiporter [Candidatus Bathyarchaeota archaeon]|nr:cation:proton antiporter [Candidatus Bathyarchaeota archaeon]